MLGKLLSKAKAMVPKVISGVEGIVSKAGQMLNKVAAAIPKMINGLPNSISNKLKEMGEKNERILEKLKKSLEEITLKRGILTIGAIMYPQPQNAWQLQDLLLEARKIIIEEYPILNWQSNVLKGAIGGIKGGLTKMGESYGSFMYDLNIPFVSDMEGEFYGVREEGAESSAGSIVGAYMKGVVVDGLGGTVEGVANLAADPLEAIGGVTKILAYPEETLPQIWDGVKEYWNKKVVNGTAEDRANVTGQVVFEIVSCLVGVGVAKAAVSGAKAADKAGDTARLIDKIIPDKKVMSGGSGVKISEGKAGGVVDEIAGTKGVKAAINRADRVKLDGWKYKPSDDLYLKYKHIFDNPKYYNQVTGEISWPLNDGFKNIPVDDILKPGVKIDRYGYDTGVFASPEGTPYKMRAVAPGTDSRRYSVFEVVEPINVKSGEIAPWFDEPGGGIQYVLPDSIEELLDTGKIRRIK